MIGNATFSTCRRYRYSLTRRWSDGPTMLFVMRNPSDANEEKNDPTAKRCISFAQREHYGALEIVNVDAWVSSSPKTLATVTDPTGPENAKHITEAAVRADMIVAAWGGTVKDERAVATLQLLAPYDVYCLGQTKYDHPRHPVRLRKDTPLELYARWRSDGSLAPPVVREDPFDIE